MLHTLWFWPLLFVTGLAADWVNAITGGGGLVVLPVFLAVGVPPHLALGTNMLQSSAGTAAAAYAFLRHRRVDLREVRRGLGCIVVGTLGGVVAVQHLNPTVLKTVLPCVLVSLVIVMACSPRIGLADAQPGMPSGLFTRWRAWGWDFLTAVLVPVRERYG
jgi:uncharacterized membrane protein YfcA